MKICDCEQPMSMAFGSWPESAKCVSVFFFIYIEENELHLAFHLKKVIQNGPLHFVHLVKANLAR